jgi:hypothetical protein
MFTHRQPRYILQTTVWEFWSQEPAKALDFDATTATAAYCESFASGRLVPTTISAMTACASASTIHPESHQFCTIGSPEEGGHRCAHCNTAISKLMYMCGDCPPSKYSLCISCYPSAAQVHPEHSSWSPASLRDYKGRGLRCHSCN